MEVMGTVNIKEKNTQSIKKKRVDSDNTISRCVKSDKPEYFVPLQDSKHKLPRKYKDLLTISGKLILLPVIIVVGVFTGVYAGFCKVIETIHSFLIEEG